MPRTEIVWQPQPGPQKALVDCPLPEVFYGGARGGGKTDGVLGKWALKEKRYGDKFNAVMFRRTTVSAEDAIERAKQIFVPLGAKFTSQPPTFRMANGGRVAFRYLETVSDADEYQGRNLTDAWIEEAGQYERPAPIDRLWATLRSTDGVPTQLILTANPGGAGQHWLRERYKLYPLPDKPIIVERELPNGATHQAAVIPSRVYDNLLLMHRDPDYINRLYMSGSEKLVAAWLDGDWSAIEGAYFDEFSTERHVIRPCELPDHWLRFRSMDWGSAHPFAVGWWAHASEDWNHPDGFVIPKGALVMYREWYGAKAPNVGVKMDATEVAAGILAKQDEEVSGGASVLDPSAFSVDGGPSIAERMAKNGVLFHRADNRRVASKGAMGGWDVMRERLKGDSEGRPMIFWFSTCEASIRTIPTLQHDEKRPEDLDTDQEDHCLTADTFLYENNGLVWSAGAWRPYRNARLTKRDAELHRVHFSDGSSIRCTPDHRFWTTSGWVEARNLSQSILPLSQPQGRNSEESVTTFAALTSCGHGAATRNGIGRGFIGRSGYTITERYLRGIRSIISTVTRPITDSTTLQFCPCSPTRGSMRMSASLMGHWPLSQNVREKGPLSGTRAMKGESGTKGITKIMSLRSGWQRFTKNVKCAALYMRLFPVGGTGRNSVVEPASSVRCVGVEPAGRGDVYCLTVPGTERFTLANGVTISNCADMVRYACMARPYMRPAPTKPDSITRQPTFDEAIAQHERIRSRREGRL